MEVIKNRNQKNTKNKLTNLNTKKQVQSMSKDQVVKI